MTSDPQLKRWYCQFNRQYFGGELPVETVDVFWEPCGQSAMITQDVDGEPDTYIVRADPMLHGLPKHTKRDLLHEMVHIRLWPFRGLTDHGKRFDREIERLCTFRSYRKLL